MLKVYIGDVSDLKDAETFENLKRECIPFMLAKAEKSQGAANKYLRVGAGVLLGRALLAEGINPKEIQIDYNEHGKPFITGGESVFFNLSHSGERVMCAVSDKEVGCDTDRIGRGDIRIAKRFFTKGEYNTIISRADENSRNEMFIRMWTLKESFLKMIGTGLSISPRVIEFCFEDDILSGCKCEMGQSFYFGEYTDGEYRYAWCTDKEEKADIKYIRLN